MFSITLIVLLSVLAIGSRQISIIYGRRRVDHEAASRGCERPPLLPRKGFLGLGRLSEVSRANKEGRTPQWFIEKFEEVGEDVHTFSASALDYELIVTRDPENMRAMFQTDSKSFEISPHRKDIWSPLLGDGIFTSTGATWKHSRQLLRPQFSRDQISDLEMEERHVQSMLSLDTLKANNTGWTEKVDLAPLFLNLTMDVATDFLYGRSVNSQSNQKQDIGLGGDHGKVDSDFSYHLDGAKSWLYTKGLFGRWNRFIHAPAFTRHCKQVHQFVDGLVARRLDGAKRNDNDTKRFFLLDELAKYTQDPLELRNETLQLLNAGRDTTGALLGWIFYFLARNDRVFGKLRSVLLSEFGSDGTGDIQFQRLKQCEYLQHCIQEVLRVAAVVPVNERVAIQDTILPCGGGLDGSQPIFVQKGQKVLIANYAMQHRADLWGEDVNEFKPERWETRKVGWDFLPFGGGPRKCIGQQFALTEAAYIVVRFLQRFDAMENMEEPGRPVFHYIFSNRSGTGVQVRLHEAAV